MHRVARLLLPACRHRWINCATVIPVYLPGASPPTPTPPDAVPTPSRTEKVVGTLLIVCGDRRGSLHVYKVPASGDEAKVLRVSVHVCMRDNGVL